MRFEDLYVLYEGSLRLIKGNFDKPLSAKEYNQGIKSNIANSDKYGYNSVRYFIGKPGQRDSNYISLYYQIVASSEMPAKHFKYEIPDTTLQKFRTQREIFNRTNPSFLAGRSNVFYYNGKPIPKIFAESNLEEVMGELINAN